MFSCLVYYIPVSTAISDCACGCGGRNVPITPVPVTGEKRDSPPRNFQYEFDIRAEVSKEETPVKDQHQRQQQPGRKADKSLSATSISKRRDIMKNCNLPSGLSVEMSDPEMESTL